MYRKAPFDSWSGSISWAKSLKDGIYVVSKDYRVLFMNQTLIDMIGDKTGNFCYQTLFQRDTPCPWSVMNQTDREDACFIQEYYLRVADTEKVFEVRSMPIRLHDGTIAKLGHMKEITETRKLEIEVNELAARRRAIEEGANRADLGVFILQVSQGKEARFRFANEAVSRITG